MRGAWRVIDNVLTNQGLQVWRENVAARVAAQPGIAVDRFARKIAGILKAFLGALAATECQAVGRQFINTYAH